MHDACVQVQDAWPERVALRLDLAASDHGLTPAGLGERTLAVGAYSGQRLSALLDQAVATETPDEGLRRAVNAASHGFDGCADHGALVALEEHSVCGEERRVTGPEGAACRALDDECGRGYFDDEQGCCALRPRALGVGCAEGAGRCDGNGACIPLDAEDGMAVELPEGVDAAIGLPSWLDHTSAEAPSVWLTDDGMQLGLGGQTVVDLSGADGAHIPYDAVHLLGDAVDRSAAGVVVDVPDVLRTLYLEPRADRVAAPEANGDGGVAEPGEAVLTRGDAPLRVIAVLQSSGDLSSAFADVGAAGRVELGCPGEDSGIRCELSGAGVKVSGDDLAFALVSHGAARNIMPTALYGFCLFPPCSPPPPVCHYPQAQSCTAPCGKPGLRYCTWNGSWGTCHAYGSQAEVCNGLDDDCDGAIDENGTAICDDGLTCNTDSCDSHPTWHWVSTVLGGYWSPPSGSCKHPVAPSCADSHTCATPICSATVPTSSAPGRSVGTIDVLNHCYEELDSNYCTNTWDACNCNGPEFCAPAGNADPSGCVMSPGSAAPCEAHDSPKPDDDGLHGSHIDPYHTIHHPGGACTIEACVEDSSSCNWAHIGLADPEDLRLARLGWDVAGAPGNHHPGTLYTRPDGTAVQVQCPDNEIWNHKTYLEPGCDDDNSCTDDYCNPSLGPLVPGGCVYTPVPPLPAHCDPRPTRNHESNGGTKLACGIPNYSCGFPGVCSPINPVVNRPRNCTPVSVPAPSGTVPHPFYRRNSFSPNSQQNGWNYEYGSTAPHRAGFPSCHRAICSSGGSCTVDTSSLGLDPDICTAGHGCIVDSCSAATDVMDSNGVVGCEEHPSDGLCPAPLAGDCRIRPVGACQPDGSCVLLPNDSKCASRLSAANECLVATCQADGSCGITENTNLCDFGCGPTEAASQPTCERHTTGGHEYGLCRSLGCSPVI